MIVRCAGRMREFADARRILPRGVGRQRRPIALQHERGQCLDAVGTEGKLNVDRSPVVVAAMAQPSVARITLVRGTEGGIALRRLGWEFVIGAEAEIVEVVIRLDNEAAVGELSLKMRRIRRAVADLEGAEQWPPTRAVG